MARMFPDRLPASVLADPGRGAERRVYEALSRSLDDGWTVFYGVAWIAPTRAGGARNGEVDFIIAHPARGVVLIEVKGGEVGRDGTTRQWYSRSAAGRQHSIQDPFEQVRTSRYALADKIKEHPAWRRRDLDLGQAVWFPDCGAPAHPLAPDSPADIVLFAEDLARAGERVPRVFDYWFAGRKNPAPPGVQGMEMLVGLLAASFQLRTPLGPTLAEEDRRIVELTEQQYQVLDLLRRQTRVAVSGGAGTGKTMLALEKARRLAGEGFRVLLTCFNRPLADHLRRRARDVERLDVLSFHQLCFQHARDAGVRLADPEAPTLGRRYFEEEMPQALEKALYAGARRYHAVIVDEAQDFLDGWWASLELALDDAGPGILYVFHDDNQTIYPGRTARFPKQLFDISLTRNLRNTRRIFAMASRFYRGGELESAGPEGHDVELVHAPSDRTLEKEVGGLLARLIRDERVEPEDIAVLSATSMERALVGRSGKIGLYKVTRDQDAEPGRVLLDTIHRFKGLERPVIVLTELEHLEAADAPALLYVGTSRARTHLAVVGTPDTLARLGISEAGGGR